MSTASTVKGALVVKGAPLNDDGRWPGVILVRCVAAEIESGQTRERQM
jgi:hypothetical protein